MCQKIQISPFWCVQKESELLLFAKLLLNSEPPHRNRSAEKHIARKRSSHRELTVRKSFTSFYYLAPASVQYFAEWIQWLELNDSKLSFVCSLSLNSLFFLLFFWSSAPLELLKKGGEQLEKIVTNLSLQKRQFQHRLVHASQSTFSVY